SFWGFFLERSCACVQSFVVSYSSQTSSSSVIRVTRRRMWGSSSNRIPNAVEVIRVLGSKFDYREVAVTLNRMRCASDSGGTWTIARVRELRERLGIAAFNPKTERSETISADGAAPRWGISIP